MTIVIIGALLLLFTTNSAFAFNASTNLIDAIYSAFIGSSQFENECLTESCPGLNQPFLCNILNPDMPSTDFLKSYLNVIKKCAANNICGTSLNPLHVKNVNLTIDHLSDGSKAKCQMDSNAVFEINGIPNIAFIVTKTSSNDKNNISFHLNIALDLSTSRLPFNCVVSKPQQNNLFSIALGFFQRILQLLGLYKPPASTETVDLVVDKFYYNVSGGLDISILDQMAAVITVPSTPTVNFSPINTFGSASQLLQQAAKMYLSEYLVSELVKKSLFEDVKLFYYIAIQSLIDNCN